MIKKLIISAVVLTALISAKESHAAGAGGFARALASVPAVHMQMAENRILRHDVPTAEVPSAARRNELLEINSAVNSAIYGLDSYLGGFDQTEAAIASPQAGTCFDCADIKRDRLSAKGWSQDKMRIAYAVTAEGRIERVLVVSTESGEIALGNDSQLIDLSASQPARAVEPIAAIPYFDI